MTSPNGSRVASFRYKRLKVASNTCRSNLRVILQHTLNGDRMISFHINLGHQGKATLPGKQLAMSLYRRAVVRLAAV
jgi:hypothetical protein